MKDEMVQLLVQKVGLEEAVAKTVVDEVVEFLGSRLPDPYGDLLTKVMVGDEDGFGLDDAADLIGGLFGRKKD